MGLFLIYSDYLFAENTLTSTTITNINFRIRIFNFCTSNCTPYLINHIFKELFGLCGIAVRPYVEFLTNY